MAIIKADPELADLIPDYLESRKGDLPLPEAALRSGDFATIASLGHRMRGTGASFGFAAITEIGDRLEQSGTAADRAGCRQSIDALAEYLTTLQVEYPQAA
jgi:HPt (histidine-containing phosphotransfer) domain-containing protein